MHSRKFFGIIVMLFVMVQVGYGGEKSHIQKYFNNTITDVEATADPAEKREILNNSLQTMTQALEKVQSSGLVPQEDRTGVDHLKSTLQERQDELMGNNGFQRVADGQLNAFSNFVSQDMEQADRTISISLVTVLLIVLILVLIL